VLWTATEVIACSDFVAKIFRKEFPDLAIRVLGHGVDLVRFEPCPRDQGQTIVFGYLGTLSRSKGVGVLAEAFTQAAPKKARLELVGSAYGDSALLSQLSALQSTSFKVLHAVDHKTVPAILSGFDILCLPSLLPETYSLALHEGFAGGLPALVSDLGWPAEIIRKAECGRVAAAGDVDDWANAIGEISEHREILKTWKNRLPLPLRVEEESFFYEQLYRRSISAGSQQGWMRSPDA
jgi:glycosyltransferase involved in cell wall biosynthesis